MTHPAPSLLRVFSRRESLWISAAALGFLVALGLKPAAPAPNLAAPFEAQPAAPALPGWAVTVTSADGTRSARTSSHFASFVLAPTESLALDVPGPGLTATFETTLTADKTGPHRWALDVEGGRASIIVSGGGKQIATASGTGTAARGQPGGVVTNWAELTPGEYAVVITFTRNADSPARLRTVWEKQWIPDLKVGLDQGFLPEPIPTVATRAPANRVADASLAREGRVLLSEFGCTSCHAPFPASSSSVAPRQGPLLAEISRRASPDWLVKWIANPTSLKPHTHMPDVIGDGLNEPNDAVNITHYLVSLSPDPGPAPDLATEAQGLAQGRLLYHTLGCVACHGPYESPRAVFTETTFPDTLPPSDNLPAPHGNLAGKWRPDALREFLLNPLRTHPSGRMPDMKLSQEEADLITRYLMTQWNKIPGKPSTFKVDPGRAALGKVAFAAKGCADCHQLGAGAAAEVPSTLKAKPLADLAFGKGCTDPADTKSPRFGFRDADLRAIAAGLASAKSAVAKAPLEHTQQSMLALNCRACHAKDGTGGVSRDLDPYFRSQGEKAELGDEGRIPPQLTLVGWKLTSTYTRRVLTEAARARPYMSTRMPQYGPANVEHLVAGLAGHDGERPDSDAQEPKPTDELVAAGRRLVGDQGLNCISCHVWGDLPPAGTAGPSITEFAARLRYDWWRSYILQPKRFKPGTRMSEFYLRGRSSAVDVLKGDAFKQPDAMWAYFHTGQFGPPPSGVGSSGADVKLNPDGKPIVFRSFLEHAGSRGIAVGFPAGTHFAFDATQVRLVEVWKGAFLDASGAWKGRGGSITGGTGDTLWTAPTGPLLVIGSNAPDSWPTTIGPDAALRFNGYILDEQGVPTFQSSMTTADLTLRISERITPGPAGEAAFTRVLTIAGAKGKAFWINAGTGTIIATCRTPIRVEKRGDQTLVRVLSFEDQVDITLAVNP